MANKHLIKYLENFRDQYENSDDPVASYKIGAYDKVIKGIEQLSFTAKNFHDLSSVKGIGSSIKDKLQAYFETKKHEKGKKTKESIYIEELQQVHGIGPVKARKLIEAGITSIRKLKRHPSFLNDKQKIALKYVDTAIERIPRAEMDKHAHLLIKAAKKIDPNLFIEVVGSYRRGAATSGDIDVLISDPEDNDALYHDLIRRLKKKGYLIDDLAYGNKKYLGYCSLKDGKARRIDLLFTPTKELPFAELYFTGSQELNIEMRNIARDQGYKLSEHGLKGAKTTFETEGDIFDFFGMEYLLPEDR